ELLEAAQNPGPEAQTAGGGRHPHALDLAMGRVTLQGAAPDRLPVQGGQDEVATRGREVIRRGRYAARGVVAGVEPGRELREVVIETVSCRGTVGRLQEEVDGLVDPHPRGPRSRPGLRRGRERPQSSRPASRGS